MVLLTHAGVRRISGGQVPFNGGIAAGWLPGILCHGQFTSFAAVAGRRSSSSQT